MGLSDDQRAMLRMVAQRGEQGYEDIAALMGLSVDEVRARVAAALAELDSEGALTGEAKAAAEQQAPTEEPPAEQPQAQEPPAPAEPAAAEPPPPPPLAAAQAPPSQPGKPPWIKLPSGSGLRAAIGAAIAVIALVAVIVIVTGRRRRRIGLGERRERERRHRRNRFGEDRRQGRRRSQGRSQPADEGETDRGRRQQAEGVAIFGRVKKKLALELAAQKLQPTQQGQAYTIWLSKNKQKMLPLASTRAPKGRIAAKFEIPVEVLGYLADETFTDLVLTRTEDTQLEAALEKAAKAKTTPDYTGTEVLRGKVTGPIVGAQFRLEELEELEEEEAGEKGE